MPTIDVVIKFPCQTLSTHTVSMLQHWLKIRPCDRVSCARYITERICSPDAEQVEVCNSTKVCQVAAVLLRTQTMAFNASYAAMSENSPS